METKATNVLFRLIKLTAAVEALKMAVHQAGGSVTLTAAARDAVAEGQLKLVGRMVEGADAYTLTLAERLDGEDDLEFQTEIAPGVPAA